jgi:hypothetical protein
MSLLADKDLELLDGEVKTQDLGAAPSYQSSVLDNPDYCKTNSRYYPEGCFRISY